MKLLPNEHQKPATFIKESLKIYNILKVQKYDEVRDHFHYTGDNTGAAHSICNLKYRKSR